jgi:hypothetical protein
LDGTPELNCRQGPPDPDVVQSTCTELEICAEALIASPAIRMATSEAMMRYLLIFILKVTFLSVLCGY